MALGSAGGRLPVPPIIRLDADGIGRLKNRMHHHPAYPMTRREWLRLSAGALLTLGIWPGCARWLGARRAGTFRFVAINDAHFQSPRCPAWFERVAASIRAQAGRPEFCLIVGDLTEHGTTAELGQMRDALRAFGPPFHVVTGNHDYVSDADRSPWEQIFPKRLNYHFEHRGWQFVGVDSCDGRRWKDTRIQADTLRWLDDNLPRLDPARPTVLFTHFPLGFPVPMRPLNADELLDRFLDFNLVAVFNGHFHGFTERHAGRITFTTNRCCSISRDNHDGTPEKGYFLCTAGEAQVSREFVEVKMA